jgi:hypothetical protein
VPSETLTPRTPGSPSSWRSLPLRSSNTTPVIVASVGSIASAMTGCAAFAKTSAARAAVTTASIRRRVPIAAPFRSFMP